MNTASVQEMLAVLAEAEQKMLELGGSLIDLSQASFADRAALIAQTAQFNSVAARWQAETQALVGVWQRLRMTATLHRGSIHHLLYQAPLHHR